MAKMLTLRSILLASALAIAPADTLVVARTIDDIISLDPA